MISQILNSSAFGFTSICIQKEASGRPYIFIDGQGRLDGGFSLSHSNGIVFCGYSHSADLKFGLDLEKIERHTPEFIEDYFTPQEIVFYNKSPMDQKDEFATLIWSAKEATLKALGKGLAVDTRKVEVIPLDGKSEFDGWNNCDVVINSGVGKGYKVLWQQTGGFIRTISFPAGEPVRLMELDLK
jgi:phosphopantetheine--protein transferase-like protein